MEQRKLGISKDGKEMHYSAGIMLECNGKYFLMDRVNPPPGFACPGGHIDEGEEPLQAALRELREETGITGVELQFLVEEEIPWNFCKSAGVHYWYLYKASVNDEFATPAKEEAKSSGWFTPEEMKTMPLEEVWLYWFKKFNIV